MESWQNGYCTSLENWHPSGFPGSNPGLSAKLRPDKQRLPAGRSGLRFAGKLI